MHWGPLVGVFIMSVSALGCAHSEQTQNLELAMTKGTTITAHTDNGAVRITAEEGYRRRYEWYECSKAVTLWPRTQRWYGSLGIYYPGPGITWWIPCGGIWRAVVQEGQQHFDSNEDAIEWLRVRVSRGYVYGNTGLVVGWSLNMDRSQLNAEVWQIYVNGQKPTHLDGAQDDKIEVVIGENVKGL